MYLNDWKDNGKKGMLADFSIAEEELGGFDVLLASYSYQDYSGDAFVLLKKDNQLFEVNGSHCSCYGLEDQWAIEESTKEGLLKRLESGMGHDSYCGNEYANELRAVLCEIEA